MRGITRTLFRGMHGLAKHSATLCAAGAVVGLFASVVLAGDAAVEALEIDDDLEGSEKAVAYAKVYAPVAASTIVTTALIISSDRLHVKNELALGAVAAMWQSKYTKLDDKIKGTLGEEDYGQLQKDLKEDRKAEAEVPQTLPPGCILVYLDCVDQYIVTTKEKLAWAVNSLNRKLCQTGDATVNFFTARLNDNAQTQRGDGLGWSVDNPDQFGMWEYNDCRWPNVSLHTGFSNETDEYGAKIIYFDVEPAPMYTDMYMHEYA